MNNTMDQLRFYLENTCIESKKEALSNLDSIINSLIEESDNLEYGELVVGLTPEQRKRARIIDQVVNVLLACAEAIRASYDDVYMPTEEYLKGCAEDA